MKLLIRAPFIESERKRLETYFDESVIMKMRCWKF